MDDFINDGAKRRWPRVKQKGLECSVEGCGRGMTSNDLCNTHNMANKRYGSVHGKQATRRTCKGCGESFLSIRDEAIYCKPECMKHAPGNRKKRMEALSKWRERNYVKAVHRESLSKKTTRRFPEQKKCTRTGCEEKTERHHPDYAKPYQVVWLCKDHHKQCHRDGTHLDFDICQIDEDENWKIKYLNQQEGYCHECGTSLVGLELFMRGLGRRQKIFCCLECSQKDYLRK